MILFVPRVGERGVGDETSAIAALKMIDVAEVAYSSVHGHFDTLTCLAAPPTCVVGPDVSQDGFLDRDLAAATEWHGYRIEFFPGPSAWDGSARSSRSAMTRFAVVAMPVKSDARKRRAFCTDDTGKVFVGPATTVPRVDDGRCLDRSTPLD